MIHIAINNYEPKLLVSHILVLVHKTGFEQVSLTRFDFVSFGLNPRYPNPIRVPYEGTWTLYTLRGRNKER